MADNTDPLGAMDAAHAAADRAAADVVAQLAALSPDDQVAGIRADLAAAAPLLRRLKVRAAALADANPIKPTLAQWAGSGLNMPEFVDQQAMLARAMALTAPKG